MGASFLFQPAENPVRLFMVHIRNIDSVSEHQLQPFQLTPVFLSCGHQVDAGGFNAGMAQDVRQLCNVLVDPVINRGKQMPEIMGKYLGGLHIGFLAEPLHLRPELASPHGLSAFGEENLTRGNFLLFRVFQQPPAQLSRQQDGADLSLQRDGGTAFLCRLHGDIAHLADSDAGGADCFHDQRNPLPS